jgi:hypothetical protein
MFAETRNTHDPDDENIPCPDAAEWFIATIVAGMVHLFWMAIVAWYLKMPDSVLCSNDDGGFIDLFPPCPESRPGATLVAVAGVVGGLTLSSLAATHGVGLSKKQGFGASLLAAVLITVLGCGCIGMAIAG